MFDERIKKSTEEHLAERKIEAGILDRNLQKSGFKLLETNLGVAGFDSRLIGKELRVFHKPPYDYWYDVVQWQGDGDKSIYVIYVPTAWKKVNGAYYGRPWQRSEFESLAGFMAPEILGATSTFGYAGRISALNDAVIRAGQETAAFRNDTLTKRFRDMRTKALAAR